MAGSFSRAIQASRPPAWTQVGIAASSPVAPAVYGYMSAVIRSPEARAASIRRNASSSFPQFERPAALMW